ncbi:PAS domain-containing sensor histidine kinase [Pontibacter sp. 172403-2]|uniref:PAS domain-containing sensor histidine kinase n=1 Tax=Pontibacter rufus TaxID=2791028 RepID=UPI0018AFFA03|nr:PAS domain-containing sensor histidine kinase [Pontibacter sp. 172403-2]MBF9252996.1 PAS domain-containing sensor histidine kinase [Pontibacter sp. 172403-2]
MPHTNFDPTDLQFLAVNIKYSIFVYEVESNQFTYQNPAFEQAFKLTAQSVITPAALLDMVHPDDRQYVAEASRKLLQEKGSKEVEFRINLPEQEERWICLTPFLLNDAAAEHRIIGYVEDITASKQYNDYLKKFGNKKDSVLHILAHDLAGPLGMIHSISELLSEEVKSYGSQDLDHLISLIEKTSKHGVSLIKSLIDTEFLETTGVDLIKRRADIVVRLEEIMEQYQQSEREITKTFRFFCASKEIYIEFDDIKLLQAINNLISNSIKFTHEGGIITVSLEEHAQTVLIKVADNGIGIPEKYHDTLFDKFTNARRPGLDGEPSTGLGMSIIKTIVEWHQGRIWFESEVNVGTTFYIELPKE